MLHYNAVRVGTAVAGRDAALVQTGFLIGAVVAGLAAHEDDLSYEKKEKRVYK